MTNRRMISQDVNLVTRVQIAKMAGRSIYRITQIMSEVDAPQPVVLSVHYPGGRTPLQYDRDTCQAWINKRILKTKENKEESTRLRNLIHNRIIK